MPPLAAILGCAGARLAAEERRFFARVNPFGFILFARNVEAPQQVSTLVAELRDAVGRASAPVLVDQEGGRVQRLRPPHWRAAPPAAGFGALAGLDQAAAVEAVRLNARLIADELAALGIDTVCAPVLDLRHPGAHDVIGDRAFSADPDIVALLGRAACEGFCAGGVAPIVKHMPGHGRSQVDSHLKVPVVAASLSELDETDFRPFRALADRPLGMTGHLVIRAVDPERPATVSPRVIAEVIRGRIGFKGVLISDDLSMQALAGSIAERASLAIAAGCDLALHCTGRMEEMAALADRVPPLPVETEARWMASRPTRAPRDAEPAAMAARVDELLRRAVHA